MIPLKPSAAVLWRYAITDHQKGDARRLVNLLGEGGELPPFAREYLAQIVAASARRSRGRPKQRNEIAVFVEQMQTAQDYDLALAVAQLDDKTPGTPSERALEQVAKKHGVNAARTIERRLQKWRTRQ